MNDFLTPDPMIDYLNGFDDPQERHEAALGTVFADALMHVRKTGCSVPDLIEAVSIVNGRLKGELSEREVFETSAQAYRRAYEDTGQGSPIQADPEGHLRSLVEEVESWDPRQVFKFGIGKLDESFGGLLPGEVLSLPGHQGSMKTSLALTGADTYIQEAGGKVLFLSLDMPPQKIIARRLMKALRCTEPQVRYHIKEHSQELRDAWKGIQERNQGRFKLVGKEMRNPRLILGEPSKLIDLRDVLECIEIEAPDVVIIDYLTKIQANNGKPFRSDLDVVQTAVPSLQRCAERRKISMVLLSQIGRANKTAAKTGDSGGHAKGGGIVEEVADAEIELLKDTLPEPQESEEQVYRVEQPPIIATVTKTRRGVAGKSFSLKYIGQWMEFTGEVSEVRRASARKPAFALEGCPF